MMSIFACQLLLMSASATVELVKTKTRDFPPLFIGEIIENQNSDFVMA
jgi:hypothetical protein